MLLLYCLARRYVFNSLNYVRWQNVALVDKLFAELQDLASFVLSPWTTVHPTTTVLQETAMTANRTGNIRARAWRHPHDTECVRLVVVNSVQEGALPEPTVFKLQLEGLSHSAIAGGATPIWGMGCVVNFTQPPMQAYMCRNVPLMLLPPKNNNSSPTSGSTASGNSNSNSNSAAAAAATLSDMIMATDTTIYEIGCRLPTAVAGNYAADPGFEGGLATHPMPGPPGVPG